MKKSLVMLMLSMMIGVLSYSQVGISNESGTPDPSAMLDVRSNAKGFLPPRVTMQQMIQIDDPADGLMVYCITDGKLYVFASTPGQWKEVAFGPGTVQPFACGMTMNVVHAPAGGVAPISKTVGYGTVTGIAGEPSKCWITRNLGADMQATSFFDYTAPPAGWYWQFNRKQGFSHDGSTLTPSWTVTNISENSDWLLEQDPCYLELGTAWRLPLYSEWYNVDNAGGWTNYTGPWNSPLKLHAAGYLHLNTGLLSGRGTYVYYWSKTQIDLTTAWSIYMAFTASNMDADSKWYGFSVRCLREE
jgi:hypothetical protein